MTFLAMIAAFISVWPIAALVILIIIAVAARQIFRMFRRERKQFVVESRGGGYARWPQVIDELPGRDVARMSQGVHQGWPRRDDFESLGKDGRIVGRQHFAHTASHFFVDYLCAVTGQTYSHRCSEDMRRVEAMFFQAFESGECTPRHASLSELASGSGSQKGLAKPVDNIFGAQFDLKFPGSLRAERQHNFLPRGGAVKKG